MDDRVGHADGRWPNGKTLLVVVDDDATRIAFTLFLVGEGFIVIAAENGQEALDHLGKNRPPSVILLDLMMPVMASYEFRQAQRNDPAQAAIPMIILCADCEALAQADNFGDVRCVQKPVDGGELLAAIQHFTVPFQPEILVVEDEPAVLKLLDMALRRFGFGVRLAASGQEAVAIYQSDHEAIAIVLLDVQMPDLDGPGTIAALKSINPEVRYCFMSGHTGKYTVEELIASGAAHVFMKPFESLNLVARLLRDIASAPS